MGASRACRSLRTPPWGALRAYKCAKERDAGRDARVIQ